MKRDPSTLDPDWEDPVDEAVWQAALARFERGTVILMTFMVEGMDVGSNAMLPRYGVNSVLDTPKLVFLDQRKADATNRQVAYKRDIDEESVVAFLREHGIPDAEPAAGADGAGKDEL